MKKLFITAFLTCLSLINTGCYLEASITSQLPSIGSIIAPDVEYATDNKIPTGSAFSLFPSIALSENEIAVISPALPAGLSFDNFSGVVSGTPTVASSNTIYTVTIQKGLDRSTATFSLLVDPTAPSSVVITDGTIQADTTTLNFSWTPSTDNESGIAQYQYAVGTTAGATNFINWTTSSVTTVSLTGLSLINNQSYFISVKITNGAGMSTITNSNGIFIGTLQDDIWVTAYQEGDNIQTITYGAKLCTASGCNAIANFAHNDVFPTTVSTAVSRALIIHDAYASPVPEFCNSSGCDSSSNMKVKGVDIGDGTYFGDNHFCNTDTKVCTPTNSFTAHSGANYYAKAVPGGIWVPSSLGQLNFIDSTTLNATNTGLSTLDFVTSLNSTYAWGRTISGGNFNIYRCANTGVCVSHGAISTAETISNILYIAPNNDGLSAWVYTYSGTGTARLRYCANSSCTLVKSGVSYIGLTKTLSGNSAWISYNSGAAIDYCTPTECTQIQTGSVGLIDQNYQISGSADKVFISKFNAGHELLSCTSSACTTVHSFGAIATFYPDKSTHGVWAETTTGTRKLFYCTSTSCTELTTLTHATTSSKAARHSSIFWYVSNNVLSFCTSSSCGAIESLGVAPGLSSWSLLND